MSRFRADSAELIRRLSMPHLSEKHEGQLLVLAAHLFAIAEKFVHAGEGRLVEGGSEHDRNGVSSLEDADSALRDPDWASEPARFFWTLIAVLQFLDGHLSEAPGGLATSETTLRDYGECDLNGRILHWTRPRRVAFRQERELRKQREASIVQQGGRVPPRPAPHPAHYLDRITMFWSQPAGPDIGPSIEPLARSALVEDSGAAFLDGTFKIALCPLPQECHPQFRLMPESQFQALHASSVHEGDLLSRHLTQVVHAASDQGVNLLVFPELMITPDHRHQVAEQLRALNKAAPQGVVLGSFHVWAEEEVEERDAPRNESSLMSAGGNPLLVHHKRGRFRLLPMDLNQVWFPEAELPIKTQMKEISERIQQKLPIRVLETSLGRIMTAICADLIAEDDTRIEDLIHRLRPDLLVIVAMSPETELFEEVMLRMGKRDTSTVLVNARCVINKKKALLAALNVDFFEVDEAPPGRFQWELDPSANDGEKESARMFSHKSPKEGEDLQIGASDSFIDWLGGAEAQLGVVIDLGAYLIANRLDP